MDSNNRKYICSGCNRAYARKINLGFHKNHCDAELLGETNTTNHGPQHGEGVAVGNQNGVATNDQNGEGANDQKGAAINDQNGEGANDKYIELQSALGRTLITFRKKIDGDFKVLDQIFESDIPSLVRNSKFTVPLNGLRIWCYNFICLQQVQLQNHQLCYVLMQVFY